MNVILLLLLLLTETLEFAAFLEPKVPKMKTLHEKILVGYTTNKCNELKEMSKVTTAIEEGLNVLIWGFAHFVDDSSKGSRNNNTCDLGSTNLRVESNINIENLKLYKKKLDSMGYTDVIHLVAFGGWNGPHLPSGISGKQLFEAWQVFNTQNLLEEETVLWDGIDWDLEGNDDIESPRNEFTKECLDQMGEFSFLLKKDGYIVSMAPPESYLDISSVKFSRFVNLTYPEPWHDEFQYHGWNVYAYILAKWNDCIDLIFLQFYESYSHAAYQINMLQMKPSDFLVNYVSELVQKNQGYYVQFQDDPSMNLPNQVVPLSLDKLILGFANGWAKNKDLTEDNKVVFFHPKEVKEAYQQLSRKGHVPRGFGFWVIEEEGKHGVYFTKGLNDILHIRKGN